MPERDSTRSPGTPTPARRVMVTGGAGFVGSHLVGVLLARGDHVTVVDDLSTGRRQNLPAAHGRLRFIEADLAEALAAFGDGERFDEVYHLAAAVGVRLVMEDPIRAIETNVEKTAALLRFAAGEIREERAGSPLHQGGDEKSRRGASVHPGPGMPTLITSSSEVYGKSAKSVFAEDDDAVYGPTTMGRWSYACTKAIDEYLALAYHRRGSVPAVVVRLFNTVGPRQVGEYGMVLPRFVSAALRGEPIEVHGDGKQSRCFCDVRDVAGALPRLLGEPKCHGGVFNIGSERPITIRELAELVVRTLGSSSEIRPVPYGQVFPAGFEDLRQRRPDVMRVRSAIGFEPRIGLEQTIKDLAKEMAQKQPLADARDAVDRGSPGDGG